MFNKCLLFLSSVLLLNLIIFSGCALYPPSGRVVIEDENTKIDVRFTDNDKHIIKDYYRHNLPPGLAKRSSLPPGLQKQLKRKGSLPPGLSVNTLPHDLEHKLSHLPDGYIRVRIETDILLMNSRTNVILDTLTID